MMNMKIINYLFIMLLFQILIIAVSVAPLSLDASEKLHFIVITDCGLLGATIRALSITRKTRENSKEE